MNELKKPGPDASPEVLWAYIHALETENERLQRATLIQSRGKTVNVPHEFQDIFALAMQNVEQFFQQVQFKPEDGVIEVNQDRYILVRASSLASDFFKYLRQLYTDRDAEAAFQTGQDFLFDIGHVLGIEDARCFSEKMGLHDPIEKLSAGPVQFAYAGWGFVDIHPESRPEPNENYLLKYSHPNSFEADSWLSQGRPSKVPVCIMNAAYSSGWCEESFGFPLTAVETECRAKGDENCTFIMAPPHKIQDYLDEQMKSESPETPLFFNRKLSEEKIIASLKEKEVLLQEIHHRVKNNLQVIVSLMALQINSLKDNAAIEHLRYTQSRVSSIAMIHEMLYQSENFNHIPYHHYIERLLQELIESLGNLPRRIQLQVSAENIYLGLREAIPLGLIINELGTNAIKHAFPETHPNPILEVSLTESRPGEYTMSFRDNGVGLGKNLEINQVHSLGLKLVQRLSHQIQAKLVYRPHPKADSGSCFELSFAVIQT